MQYYEYLQDTRTITVTHARTEVISASTSASESESGQAESLPLPLPPSNSLLVPFIFLPLIHPPFVSATSTLTSFSHRSPHRINFPRTPIIISYRRHTTVIQSSSPPPHPPRRIFKKVFNFSITARAGESLPAHRKKMKKFTPPNQAQAKSQAQPQNPNPKL